MWLELLHVKVSFNWQVLTLVGECILFLSAPAQVYSLAARYLNLVSFLASMNHRKNSDVVVYSASMVIAVQLALVFHRLVL
ncbi:hypothetical protein CTT30_06155 [Vibrio coralliilyticus]|uniref:hypothetical protein n=1 Tax=Vibrio sp. SCSIO 43145 TaxID=2819097 RepID=UPI002075DB1A|nr:hypothetical protein [Vibrio sp. SCSIO 43145]USD46735.1 hypothetical protein J4N38_06240 [Vibrio sp. SCSIO 43145]USD46736.1 hypothetical protein J4N38_06250 [Vibrio sp. SCSIO 43145]USD95707.1 hypothetical protein CTT30_06145 [Vibrio coralliilyticus]USD95708.1 hypothetical protein CTT30_06155 [Vibrio coralliilyticus]